MNPERILRNVAVYLAVSLLLIISVIWGAGALRLLSKNRPAPSPDSAAPESGWHERRREPGLGDRAGERQVLHPRGTFHEEVLRASFERLNLEEAVTLVGLLHHFRIVLAKKGGEVPPLRLGRAVESVSFLFGWDRRRLEWGFREHWQVLKHGPLADRIALRITGHPDVERIEEVPDLPGSV
jgi:hypothetical protein